MANVISLEVPTEKAGMFSVLAENVVDSKGSLILSRDTTLDEQKFALLRKYKIKSVKIKLASYGPNMSAAIASESNVRQTRGEDAKRFQAIYNKSEEDVKQMFLSISNGGTVDIQELYELTEVVMQSLKYRSSVLNYLNILRMRDNYTFSHSLNVSLLANLFARWLSLPREQMVTLTVAGLLHDIGKTNVDINILTKQDKLDEREEAALKKHPVYGYEMLVDQNIPAEIKRAALMHHERIDGSGYPNGSSGDEIDDFTKIIAICDVYDAMTADRSYRQKLCPFTVMRSFKANTYGELDTRYLLIFMENISHYYLKCKVTLSDGRKAEVCHINEMDYSKPIVNVGGKYINLMDAPGLEILSLN